MMRMGNTRRQAATLIEMIVVLACIAVLLGLLLSAIQKVRHASLRTVNYNQLRQICLGLHQLMDQNQGKIDRLADLNSPSWKINKYGLLTLDETTSEQSLFYRLLPFVYKEMHYHQNMTEEEFTEYMSPIVPCYRNPLDYTLNIDPLRFPDDKFRCKISYAYNMSAMNGVVSLSKVVDGTSSTIAFGEKFFLRHASESPDPSDSAYAESYQIFHSCGLPLPGEPYGNRRATFADAAWLDVVPLNDPVTGLTVPSRPGLTFQVMPKPEVMNTKVPHASSPGGLAVAMFDGSVRTIHPGVSPNVFWSLVTPAGGEVVSLD